MFLVMGGAGKGTTDRACWWSIIKAAGVKREAVLVETLTSLTKAAAKGRTVIICISHSAMMTMASRS